jgi:O-methyltransferase
MRRILKRAILSTIHRLGYELVLPIATPDYTGSAAADRARQRSTPGSELQRMEQELLLRDIHRLDAAEIEELYRAFLFMDLPRREERARELSDLIGTTVSEAIYLIKHLHDGLMVAGDICEFGVAQGATSKLLASEILLLEDRKLWLFDSFEGLPSPTQEDKLIHDIFKLGTIAKYKGTMASPEKEVLDKLGSINFPSERIKIKKGWVKDTINSTDLPTQVAFAYVDFDFYDPIKDALQFIDGRMPPGGRIVIDDYGYFSEGAQLAVDRFVEAARGRYTFELPLSFAGHFCVLGKVT